MSTLLAQPPREVRGPIRISPDHRYFVDSQCTVFLHLDKMAAKQVRVTWINPTTGERKQAGVFRTGNLNGKTFPDGQTEHFSTPGHWEDVLILLEGVE